VATVKGGDDRGARRASSVRAWRWLRALWDSQVELWEREALVLRPWEEEFLHWSGEEAGPRLHGSVVPPSSRRRYSVTRAGWCPCCAPGALTPTAPEPG
jgi:hypothetical protein